MKNIMLPVKTRIAAWWMVLVSVPMLVLFGRALLTQIKDMFFNCSCLCAEGAICSCICPLDYYFVAASNIISVATIALLFMLSWRLLRGRKWAWYGAVIACILIGIGSILPIWSSLWPDVFDSLDAVYLLVVAMAFFIPAVLLFMDRKDFFKVSA